MKGTWIWEEDNTRCNDWVVFEKTFLVKEKQEDAVLCVAAETKYTLWVNGQLQVVDGGLYRESTPGCGYYDKIPLHHVAPGENKLVFLVWFHGNEGRCSVTTGRAGLCFSCEAYGFESDEETRCVREPAYGESGAPEPSYLYGGYQIAYDARRAVFDPETMVLHGLHPAAAHGVHGCAPWGQSAERPVPLIAFEDVFNASYEKIRPTTYRVLLPRCRQVHPWLWVMAEAGACIEIRSDRYEVHGGPGDSEHLYRGHRTEYYCKKGVQMFEALDWMSAEQLIFEVPEQVKILGLGYRVSRYDTRLQIPMVADPQLQTLLTKCVNTLEVCMRDGFMDCPDRERGQWIGDVSVQAPQVFYAGDSNAVLLLKKAIHDFISLRKGDRLVGNVPGVNFCELPPQSLNAISERGMIAEYYVHTGDRETARLCYGPMVRYLQLWELDEQGLVIPRKGDWPWQDHLYNIDARVLENCWYYSALRFTAYLGKELQEGEDAFLQERLHSIEANFETVFWHGNRYSSLEGLSDERANAMAVLTGLAKEEHRTDLRNLLCSTMNCSPYFEYYVLAALCELDCKEDAMYRMMTRYYGQICSENSTIWEDFRILGTRNHAWSGGPLTIVCRYFPELVLRWRPLEND